MDKDQFLLYNLSSFEQESFYIKCKNHSCSTIFWIKVKEIDRDDQQIFFCQDCIDEEQTFNLSNYLSLRNIFNYHNLKFIEKWPPLENNELLKNIIEFQKELNTNVKKIRDTFENFKSQFLHKIDQIEKDIQKQILDIFEKQRTFQQQINDLHGMSQFIEVLLDHKINYILKENKIRQIIKKYISEKPQKEKILKYLMNETIMPLDLNFQYTKQLLSSIITLIDQLCYNFFYNSQNKKIDNSQNKVYYSQNSQSIGNNQNIENSQVINLNFNINQININNIDLNQINMQIDKQNTYLFKQYQNEINNRFYRDNQILDNKFNLVSEIDEFQIKNKFLNFKVDNENVVCQKQIDNYFVNNENTKIVQSYQYIDYNQMYDQDFKKKYDIVIDQNESKYIQFQKYGQFLYDLISNKTNYCSEQFLKSLKHQLDLVSPFLEQVQCNQIFIQDKRPIDFSLINNKKLNQIDELSYHFIRSSVQSNEYRKQIKNSPQIIKIMNILNNNYLEEEFLNEFENYLIDTYPFLMKINSLKNDIIFKDNQKTEVFDKIKKSETTLNNISQLIEKIEEIKQNQGNQPQQTQIVQKYCSNFLQINYRQKDIDTLFQNFPIFDLLESLKQLDILTQISMIKTNYLQSNQNLVIQRNQDHQISIKLNQNTGFYSNCVSDINLEQDKNYVFRFKLKNLCEREKYLMIGLMRESQIDQQSGHQDFLSCFFKIKKSQLYSGGFGIDKKEKGNFSLLKEDQIMIEMRVCIQEQMLQILDFPAYNHILSISDNHQSNLSPDNNLRLYVGLLSSNIEIIITEAKQYNPRE